MLSDDMDNKIEKQAAINGTLLPKGYSRLIDANKVDGFIGLEYDGREIKSVEEFEKILTVLAIPENPTNGDMIKALFPDISITEIGGGATIVVANDYKFNSTWWNAPYTGLNKSEPEIGRMM